MDIDLLRKFYAEEVRFAANVQNPELVAAFATVRRERFLGPGPWLVPDGAGYRKTEDADPRNVYHNVLFAIDPERHLNNGQPSGLAKWIDALELKPRNRVLHVGCGTGYYSAIMAETVGTSGRVRALEIDPELAEQARSNLAGLPQVEVECADGCGVCEGTWDAIFINAGATHPNPHWLEGLEPGGRLIFPLTHTKPTFVHSAGLMLKVTRTGSGYQAGIVSQVGIYPLANGRNEEWNQRLVKAMDGFRWWQPAPLRSLRLDEHEEDESCFCHGDGMCISQRQVLTGPEA